MKAEAKPFQKISFRMEMLFLSALILAMNVPLLGGGMASGFMFVPDKVAGGEWWRLLLHPFVHVSFYHLLLDGFAFLYLYHALKQKRSMERFAALALCAAGSLCAAFYMSPEAVTGGFCGLSGVAHGLMAYYGLDLVREWKKDRVMGMAGAAVVLIVVGKCLFELAAGDVAFSSLHIGNIGNPVTACHAGGVAGGAAAWVLADRLKERLSHTEAQRAQRRVWNRR